MIFNKFKRTTSHSVVKNDLPDGSGIMPPLVLSNGISGTDQMILRQAEYIGSFPVESLKQKDQVNIISKRLESMRNPKRCTPVIVAMGLSGIKIYNQTGQKIYMGHAMRRISYATCDPEHRQFSFLCREPNAPVALQYCHVFLTDTSDQAEELNNIIGDAFKMSYARVKNINEKVLENKLSQQHPSDRIDDALSGYCDEKKKDVFAATSEENRVSLLDKKSCLWTSTATSTPRVEQISKHEKGDAELNLTCLEEHLPREVAAAASFPSASSLSEISAAVSPTTNDDVATVLTTGSLDHPISVIPGVVQTNHLKSPTERKKSSNALSSQVQREAFSFCENRCAAFEASSVFTNVPGFRSSSELEMAKIDIPSVTSCQHPLRCSDSCASASAFRPIVNSSQGFRPISAGSGYGSCVQSPAMTTEYSGIQVANAATHAFRQASAFGGCPVVAMKETIDRTSTAQVLNLSDAKLLNSKPTCVDPIGRIPSRKMSAESSRKPCSFATTRTALDDFDWLSSNCSEAPQAPPRCDSLSSQHYDANSCAGNKDSGVNTTSTSIDGELDSSLAHVPWYQANLPRDSVMSMLGAEDDGGFVIRDSTSHPGCYALSVKVAKHENNTGVAHYLIQRTPRGVKLKGLDKEWPSLQSLVVHLTVMPEMLPCPLRLTRPSRDANCAAAPDIKSPVPATATPKTVNDAVDFSAGSTLVPDFEDADYQRLSDFSSIMADFRVR